MDTGKVPELCRITPPRNREEFLGLLNIAVQMAERIRDDIEKWGQELERIHGPRSKE